MAPAALTDTFELARLVLSRIAHPVAIIGAAHGGERSCATGTTMYVSLSPAMVAVAQHNDSRTTCLIRESGQFSVSLLHDAQQEVATAAGRPAEGPDKFATLKMNVAEPPDGLLAPGVERSLAILWCRVARSIETGDHVLFVGEVVAQRVDERRFEPLLRYRRRYMRIGHATSDESPEGYPT